MASCRREFLLVVLAGFMLASLLMAYCTTETAVIFSEVEFVVGHHRRQSTELPLDNVIYHTDKLMDAHARQPTKFSSTPTGIPSCTDQHCTSLLTTSERTAFNKCRDEVFKKTGKSPGHIKALCRFLNGTGRKVVALVSETGSGNTWVRGLLEKITGICTGAIYCDAALRNGGMIGEHVIGSSVLVVKTHTPDHQWLGVPNPYRQGDSQFADGFYEAAIILIRNPFDTFVSEWNRLVTIEKVEDGLLKGNASGVVDESHTYRLERHMFGTNERWSYFLKKICSRWLKVYSKWFISAVTNDIPVMVVSYEDIQADKAGQVARMLHFLNFDLPLSDIKNKLDNDFTMFRRVRGKEEFEHYTAKQRSLVQLTVSKLAEQLKVYDLNNSFGLDKYS